MLKPRDCKVIFMTYKEIWDFWEMVFGKEDNSHFNRLFVKWKQVSHQNFQPVGGKVSSVWEVMSF